MENLNNALAWERTSRYNYTSLHPNSIESYLIKFHGTESSKHRLGEIKFNDK